MNLLVTLFHWPDGIVVGNLIASALWAVPAFFTLARQIQKNHKAHMDLANQHHQEHMAALGAPPATGGDSVG